MHVRSTRYEGLPCKINIYLEDLKTLAADARLLRSSVCLHVVLVEINFLVLVVGGVSRTLGTLDLSVIEVSNPFPRISRRNHSAIDDELKIMKIQIMF